MKYFLLFISIFTVLSCSTSSKKPGELNQEEQRVRAVITTLDNKISGTYGKEANGDFTNFNEEAYINHLSKLKATRAQEMRDLLPQFEVKEFKPGLKAFLFCGYSSKLGIAFCDDTLCQKVERFEKASGPEVLETWKKEFPLQQCADVAVPGTQANPEGETPAQVSILKQSPKSEIILDHKYFKISYNEEHRLPNWVSYRVTSKNLQNGVAKKRNRFFSDMTLIKMKVPYAKPTDYDLSKYDRGPLAPSEDFVWNQEANDATFVMTNTTPQKPGLYRGSWKSLETKVRKWACKEESVTVISGPVLDKSLKSFRTKVSIPQKFYKIVVDETAPRKAIAFIFDQEDKKFDMNKSAVSMADAEKLAGITFESESGLTPAEYKKLRTTFKADDWVEGDCMRKVGKK